MSGENIRTFLIMSHGSWPEKIIKADAKGRQYAANGPLHISLKDFNSTTRNIGGNYKNIADTIYKIPNKTRLFTTTNYGNLAIACPKYDMFIKNYIGKYGINIFTSPELINSLNQRYEFIKNSRLYTDGNKIVDIDISFEDDAESWNIWEKVGHKLNPVPVTVCDLKKEYKLSEIINTLTSTVVNGGIAVPNQKTQIILHCCMPKIDNWSWDSDEYAKLESKINFMMRRGTFKIRNLLHTNKFKEKKTKRKFTKGMITRSQNIRRRHQIINNRENTHYYLGKRVRLLRDGFRLLTPPTKSKITKTTRPKRTTTAGKKRTTTAGKK